MHPHHFPWADTAPLPPTHDTRSETPASGPRRAAALPPAASDGTTPN